MQRRWTSSGPTAGLAALILTAGCESAPPVGASEGDSGSAPPSAFTGIESVTWDGVSGLDVDWGTATGGEDSTFTLTVAQGELGNEIVGITDTHAFVDGLADGEYLLTVTTTGPDGEVLGAQRSLHQLVGLNRLVYRGEVKTSGGARAVAGVGDVVVVGGGMREGVVTLVDLSDPREPRVLSEIAGLGEVSDVDLSGGLLAVAQDTILNPDETASVELYDATDLENPTLVGTISAAEDAAHTLNLAGDSLFIASTQRGAVAVYDVSNPGTPLRLAAITPPPPAAVHDQTVVGTTLYTAYGSGVAAFDVTAPAAAVLLGATLATWENPFLHNVWPTADGTVLAVSEEAVGGSLHVYAVSDSGAIAWRSTVQVSPQSSIHNAVVRETYAFCAWYVDGLRVYDLSDPTEPLLVGWYDTWAGNEDVEQRSDGSQWPNVNGATHVFPFGTHVAVSDAARGVIAFDFFPVTRTWGDGWVD